ncbi:MAG: histidinol-phosphatase HisJ family protein [Lachnospiraceae bacterium]|nr:histidinol-phosphatase HisJ family protein [Lachnospiraceae bacterium]
MIFPDYHLHSKFSSDSDTDIYDIIHTARQRGMTSICLTDHYDMDFPSLPEAPGMDFNLDIDTYYTCLKNIQAELSKDFDLRIGVELGIMPETIDKLNTYVNEHPFFDFIIASVHLVDGMDPYYPRYFEGKTEHQAFLRYFESILYFAKKYNAYDVCGHLDYIVRYGKNKANNYNPVDYYDIFNELFKTIIPKGKGIELNTGSLYKDLDFAHPHPKLLKMYKEAGGEIITIGSDAHKIEFIGYGFDKAREFLLSNGFKYYCTFKQRKPTFHKL